jgi:hypothetical protein
LSSRGHPRYPDHDLVEFTDAKELLADNLGASFELHRVGQAVDSSKTGNDPSLVDPA